MVRPCAAAVLAAAAMVAQAARQAVVTRGTTTKLDPAHLLKART
jgi:hypothetical protein